MTTPKFICGAECGIAAAGTASAGVEHWSSIGNVPSVVTSGPSPGMVSTRCFQFDANDNLIHTFASSVASGTPVVARFKINIAAHASTGNYQVFFPNSGAVPNFRFYMGIVDGVNAFGPGTAAGDVAAGKAMTYNLDQWYTIDLRFNQAAGTVDWQVDGTAKTQYTAGNNANAIASFQIGCVSVTGTGSPKIFVDDLIVSATSGDYPIGKGNVVGLYPASDKTNNAATPSTGNNGHIWSATSDFGKGAGGTNATGAQNAESTSWQSLANPLSTSIGTNYIGAIANASTEQICWVPDALPSAAAVNGVQGVVATHSATATANAMTVGMTNSAANRLTIVNNLDLSESTITVPVGILATQPSGSAWTVTSLQDGSNWWYFTASDVNPDVFLDGVCLEVDYVPNANAEVTTSTGTAYNASISVQPNAGLVANTGTAYAPGSGRGIGSASSTGSALNASINVAVSSERATSTGTGFDAPASLGPQAGSASSTGTAVTSAAAIAPTSGRGAATGTARSATPIVPRGAIHTLVDTFNTAYDSTIWHRQFGTVSVSGGRLLINTTGVDVNGLETTPDVWDITSDSIFFELDVSGQTAGTSWFGVYCVDGNSFSVEVDYDAASNQLGWFFSNDSGSNGSIAYNATNHHWLRFRESSGTVYIDASPDTTSWTNLGSSASAGFSIPSRMVAYLGALNLVSGDTVYFDNVNNAPAPSTNANAGVATSTGTGNNASASLQPSGGLASGTGTSNNGEPSIQASISVATSTGTGFDATPSVAANAGVATSTGTVNSNGSSVEASASSATSIVTGSALPTNPVASTLATSTGAAAGFSATIGGGKNRLLILTASGEAGATPPTFGTPTFNGVSMHLVGGHDTIESASASDSMWMYYLLDSELPAAGTYTAAISITGVSTGGGAAVHYFENVAQRAPENTVTDEATIDSTTFSSSVLTKSDNAIIIEALYGGITGVTFSQTSGQTEIADFSEGGGRHGVAYLAVPTPATTTLGWSATGSENRYAYVAASFAAFIADATTSVTPNAGNAAGTGTAYDATVTTSGAATNANAEVATSTGTANNATISLAASGSAGSGTGASGGPSTSVAVNAEATSSSGVASNAVSNVQPNAEAALASGTAFASGGTASAGIQAATATGAAGNAAASIAGTSGSATGTGTSSAPTPSVAVNAGLATATGTAYSPGGTSSASIQAASATGTANVASISLASNADVGTSTGSSGGTAANVAPTPVTGSAAGTAYVPGGTASASIEGAASTATSFAATVNVQPNAELVTNTGSSSASTPSVAPSANVATSTGAAYDATATASADGTANAEVAAATGSAQNASISISASSGAGSATGTASGAAGSIGGVAGGATGTGTSSDPALSVALGASNASSTGSALDASSNVAVGAEAGASTGTAIDPFIPGGVNGNLVTTGRLLIHL